MIQLILVRHGVTEWNEQRRYIGSTDLDLTAKGMVQARAASNYLKDEPLTAIYSSSYKRARQTAEIIGENHTANTAIMTELNEIDFGKWEGLTFEEISEAWPNFLQKWLSNEAGFPPQGESILHFNQRIKLAATEIKAHNPGGNVAIIAHAGTIKLLICHFLDLTFPQIWKMRQDSGSVSIMELYNDGQNVLTRLNDTCHLRELDTS